MKKVVLIIVFSSEMAFADSLTEGSYQEIKIGMTSTEASDLLNDYTSDKADYDEGWGCYYLHPKDKISPRFMILNEKITRIEVVSKESEVTTSKGLGIGSTKQEVLLKYDNVQVSPHYYRADGEYLEVKLENGYGLIFATHNGIVTNFHLGSYPGVGAVEGCY